MGINQEQIEASEVIIRLADRDLVIINPEVARVNMMGQETFQIVGEVQEQLRETTPEINEDDVQTVVDQTGVSQEIAKQAIEDANGDLAQAIMSLQEDE
jgi:nascent polypeptide-associated complex subunit alpha